MYDGINSVVSFKGQQSTQFTSYIGVRQGENLSPLLFALYVNDIEEYMLKNNCVYLNIDNDEYICEKLKLLLLLYADDSVIISDNKTSLQHSLNVLQTYCEMWKLKVNVKNTKIVIFSKRKKKDVYNFTYDGNQLEIVDHFCYLGVIFSSNGSTVEHFKKTVTQAQRAAFALISRAKRLEFPLDTILDLYKSMVLPILLYGCEAWGCEKLHIIERFQLQFLKCILNLKKSTPNVMVYGETGIYPIEILVKCRLVKYWAKIISPHKKSLTQELYNVLLYKSSTSNKDFKWLKSVKTVVENTGFSYVWDTQYVDNVNSFINLLECNLKDQYIQSWHETLYNGTMYSNYRMFKQSFGSELYLTHMLPSEAIILCRFRTGNSNLAIVRGRYNNVPRPERLCDLCNTNLGDEYHSLLECTGLIEVRKLLIKPYYCRNPNTLKFSQLMNSKKRKELGHIVKFIKLINKKFVQF